MKCPNCQADAKECAGGVIVCSKKCGAFTLDANGAAVPAEMPADIEPVEVVEPEPAPAPEPEPKPEPKPEQKPKVDDDDRRGFGIRFSL